MIKQIENIVLEAGNIVLDIYNTSFKVDYKEDKSPVTLADTLCGNYLVTELKKIYPFIPSICEENEVPDFSIRKYWKQCWMIDPLDGTKEFLKKNGEFTINIALIENQIPVFGIIYAPALNLMYYGEQGLGSFKKVDGNWIEISPSPSYLQSKKNIIAASRSHPSYQVNSFMKKLLNEGKEIATLGVGSSLKLCFIADGTADVYPRFGDTMEWDIAAGHAIIKYAGKNVMEYKTSNELKYNKESLLNPHFIAG